MELRMEQCVASVRVWNFLASRGCEQAHTVKVLGSGLTVYGVEIRQFGSPLAYGEDAEIRVALLRAMLEAVQLVAQLPPPAPSVWPEPSAVRA